MSSRTVTDRAIGYRTLCGILLSKLLPRFHWGGLRTSDCSAAVGLDSAYNNWFRHVVVVTELWGVVRNLKYCVQPAT